MHTTMLLDRHGERVAAYETLTGAELAVDHLRAFGDDPGDVMIVPADVSPAAAVIGRTRWRTAVATGVTTGAVTSLVAVGLLWDRTALSGGWLATLILAGITAGVCIGVAIAVLDRRTDANRGLPADIMRAERFEVRCTRRTDAARHTLARWWNPSARPASGSPPTSTVRNAVEPRSGPLERAVGAGRHPVGRIDDAREGLRHAVRP